MTNRAWSPHRQIRPGAGRQGETAPAWSRAAAGPVAATWRRDL